MANHLVQVQHIYYVKFIFTQFFDILDIISCKTSNKRVRKSHLK